MIKSKPGNGGHGLEAYDEETGKYVKVSVSHEGKEHEGWESLRDSILDANPDWRKAYDSDPNIAQAFDAQIRDQLYPEMFNAQVQYMNEHPELFDTSSEIEFSGPEDAAENMDKLFGPKFISTLLANGVDRNDSIKVNPEKNYYRVNAWAASLQMCRYGGNCRAKPISMAEYENRRPGFSTTKIKRGSSQRDLIKFYNECEDFVPFNRNCGNNFTKQSWERVKRSWYDDKTELNSQLCDDGGVNCKWYGDCIYGSAGDYKYDGGGGHTIYGCFSKKNCKVLIGEQMPGYSFVEYHESSEFFPELTKFVNYVRNNSGAIENKIAKRFTDYGVDSYTASNMASRFIKNLLRRSDSPYNQGLCAMVMGYDIMMTDGFQVDILNLNKVEVVYD